MILLRPFQNTYFIILPSWIQQTTQISNQTEAQSSGGGRCEAVVTEQIPDDFGQQFGQKPDGAAERWDD